MTADAVVEASRTAHTVTPFFPQFSLTGRVALITGATGDIGQEIARILSAAGATVMLTGRRANILNDLAAALSDTARPAHAITADLATIDGCTAIVTETVSALGRLDILVNCAGMNVRQPILEVQQETFDSIMSLNLRAAYFVSQAAARIMIDRGEGGKIINVGSLTCTIGLSEVSVYGASKAALAQLTKTMAVEWAQHNIQVNCLAPGFMLTSLTKDALWGNDEKRRWMLDRIPACRAGTPADLAGVALLLASPASNYMTGQTITVDGGLLAGSPW